MIRAVSGLYKTHYFHIVFVQLLDEEAADGMALVRDDENCVVRTRESYVEDVYTDRSFVYNAIEHIESSDTKLC